MRLHERKQHGPDIVTSQDLMRLVPSPDFPTGGQILGSDGAKDFYRTGHGSIVVRAKCHVEQLGGKAGGNQRARSAIIVTELPYLTNKAGT